MDQGATNPIDFQFLKKEAIDTLFVLVDFLKNPILGMKRLPDWSWPKLIFLAGALSATLGVLSAIISGLFFGIFAGLLVAPIVNLMMIAVLSGLFYYIFLFFYRRELSYLEVFKHLVFAAIPFEIISVVSGILPPISILGVAITGILLIVGFVENFSLPKKPIIKLIAGLGLVYVLIWISNSISFHQSKEQLRREYLPKDAEEILKEEFG